MSEDKKDEFPFLNNDEGGDSSKNQPKRSKTSMFLIFALVVMMFIVFGQVFLQGSRNLIPFSEFKARILSNEIKRVEMDSTYFKGFVKKNANETNGGNGLFNVLSGKQEDEYYETVGIYNEEFVKLLDKKKVVYSVKAREKSYLIDCYFYEIAFYYVM